MDDEDVKLRTMYMGMSLEKLANLAYRLQIDYVPPLSESDRDTVIDKILYLQRVYSSITEDEVKNKWQSRRQSANKQCHEDKTIIMQHDTNLKSDAQLIFMPDSINKDNTVYYCFDRIDDVDHLLQTKFNDLSQKPLTQDQIEYIEQNRNNGYPNIPTNDFFTEVGAIFGHTIDIPISDNPIRDKINVLEEYWNSISLTYHSFIYDFVKILTIDDFNIFLSHKGINKEIPEVIETREKAAEFTLNCLINYINEFNALAGKRKIITYEITKEFYIMVKEKLTYELLLEKHGKFYHNPTVKELIWKPKFLVETYYQNSGNIETRTYYNTQNKIHGTASSWYEDGKIKSVTCYINGILHGINKGYNNAGNYGYIVEFKNGLRDGLSTTLNSDFKVVKQSLYTNNKLNGLSKQYADVIEHENGEVYNLDLKLNANKEITKIAHRNNKFEYRFNVDPKSGNHEISLYDDQYIVERVVKSNSGEVIRTIIFFNESYDQNSIWMEFDERYWKNGKLSEIRIVEQQGLKVGENRKYTNGILRRIGNYTQGDKDGMQYKWVEINKDRNKDKLYLPLTPDGRMLGLMTEYKMNLDNFETKQSGISIRQTDSLYIIDTSKDFAGLFLTYDLYGNLHLEKNFINSAILDDDDKDDDYNEDDNDTTNGISRSYYPNGRVKLSSYIINGDLWGISRKWTDNGILILYQMYDKDKCVYEIIYEIAQRRASKYIYDTESSYDNDYTKMLEYYDVDTDVFLDENMNLDEAEIMRRLSQSVSYSDTQLVDNIYTKIQYKNGIPQSIEGFYRGRARAFDLLEYKDGLLHGEKITYYRYGGIKIKENYVNGQLEGERLTYDVDGFLELKEMYVNGKLNGEREELYTNGRTASQGLYVDDYPTGYVYKWYWDESIKIIEFHTIDVPPRTVLDGERTVWWNSINGAEQQISEFGVYAKGKPVGLHYSKNQNGEYTKKHYYTPEGIRTGNWIEVDYNGNRTTTPYINDKKESQSTVHNSKGELIEIINYVNDKRNGKHEKYFDDEIGDIEYEINYVDDLKEGDEITYSRNSDHEWVEVNTYLHGTLLTNKLRYEGKITVITYSNGVNIKESTEYNHDGERNGDHYKYDENGIISYRTHYTNDKIDKFEIKYIDGKIVSSVKYKNTIKHGMSYTINLEGYMLSCDIYYKGKLIKTTPYINGRIHGLVITYDTDGNVIGESQYINNVKDGITIRVEDKPEVIRLLYTETYVRGVKHGPHTVKNLLKNKLISESYYVCNLLHGTYREYNIYGGLKLEVEYVNGMKHGILRRWDMDNNIIENININYDVYEGSYTNTQIRRIDNQEREIRIEAFYKNGKLDGEYKSYYNTGTLYIKDNYVDGCSMGPRYQYYYNNKLKASHTYTVHTTNGENIEYDIDGTILSRTIYENHIPLKYENTVKGDKREMSPDMCVIRAERTNPLDGTIRVTEYYKDNILLNYYTKLGDLIHGPYIEYHDNGNYSTIREWVNGKLEGFSRTYNRRGILQLEELYENDMFKETIYKLEVEGEVYGEHEVEGQDDDE